MRTKEDNYSGWCGVIWYGVLCCGMGVACCDVM